MISLLVIAVLIIIASGKYGFTPVLKGMGIFIGILFFNLAAIRIYQEVKAYFKTKMWKMETKSTIAVLVVIIGIPFVFFSYLKSTYFLLGAVLSVGILGVSLLYDLATKKLN